MKVEGVLAADLLFGGQESRPSCAEQADLAELRKYDSHVQIEQAEGTNDNEGSVKQEAHHAVAGSLWLVILAVRRCHCCIHCSCRTHIYW